MLTPRGQQGARFCHCPEHSVLFHRTHNFWMVSSRTSCGQVKREEEGSQREAATSCVGLPAMRLGKVVATLSAPLRCFLACLPLGAMPLSAAVGASTGGLPLASFWDAGGGTSLQPRTRLSEAHNLSSSQEPHNLQAAEAVAYGDSSHISRGNSRSACSPVAALVVEVDLFIVPQEGDVGFAQHKGHAGDGFRVVKGFGSILQQ